MFLTASLAVTSRSDSLVLLPMASKLLLADPMDFRMESTTVFTLASVSSTHLLVTLSVVYGGRVDTGGEGVVVGTVEETAGDGGLVGMELGVVGTLEYVSGLSTSFMLMYSSSGGMSERWWGVAGEGGAEVVGSILLVISWGPEAAASSSLGVGTRRVMLPLCRIITRSG